MDDFKSVLHELFAKMARNYCKDNGIDFNSLTPEQIEFYAKEESKRNTERAVAQELEEERQREAMALRKKEELYANWCANVLPKRYASAKREDFRDSVSGLFTMKQSALILGGNGIGKSHLAWAIAKEAKHQSLEVEVINLFRLLSYIKSSSDWYSQIDQYAKVDVLIIDEYDKCQASSSDFILISELIDLRYYDMKPTIVIGNGDEQQAQKLLGQSVYSRLTGDGGKLYKLGGQDRRRNN